MKVTTQTILWHGKLPIFSIDSLPTGKFATGGADNDIKIWQIDPSNNKIQFLSNLSRHTKPVNIVRFSPDGLLLASGGDDGHIYLWQQVQSPEMLSQTTTEIVHNNTIITESFQNLEEWKPIKALSGHIDVYDVAWAPDSQYLISGSTDNSVRIWDTLSSKEVQVIRDHSHFVQGLAWDPLKEYIATQSSDRSCHIYKQNLRTDKKPAVSTKNSPRPRFRKFKRSSVIRKIFLGEINTFARRLSWSPDGALLLIPTGVEKSATQAPSQASPCGTYIFTRASLKRPVIFLPSGDSPSIVVKFHPYKFQFKSEDPQDKQFDMSHAMIYAVATLNSVLVYSTQNPVPLSRISDIHLAPITDLAWILSPENECRLAISSRDGFVTFAEFPKDHFGAVCTD
eukprot:TRINITY_DN2864_c0_g1_i1.p1 TRINITY_DN2864_c0_g1~~TRINITY_DN2864_c0_g1_i1.p1  ORF type:complete len:396 (+),score=38.22 TRINITY_DN2864_c0_g1_i1:45-1232(+)